MNAILSQVDACIAELDLRKAKLKEWRALLVAEPLLLSMLSGNGDEQHSTAPFPPLPEHRRDSLPNLKSVLAFFTVSGNRWQTLTVISEGTGIARPNIDYLLNRSRHAELFESSHCGKNRKQWRPKAFAGQAILTESTPSAPGIDADSDDCSL